MAGLKSSNNFMVCTFVALGLLNVTIISCESNSASDEIRIAQPSVGLLPVAVGHLQKSSSRQGIRCDRTGNRPKLVEENDDFDIVGNVPDMYNVRAVARTDARDLQQQVGSSEISRGNLGDRFSDRGLKSADSKEKSRKRIFVEKILAANPNVACPSCKSTRAFTTKSQERYLIAGSEREKSGTSINVENPTGSVKNNAGSNTLNEAEAPEQSPVPPGPRKTHHISNSDRISTQPVKNYGIAGASASSSISRINDPDSALVTQANFIPGGPTVSAKAGHVSIVNKMDSNLQANGTGLASYQAPETMQRAAKISNSTGWPNTTDVPENWTHSQQNAQMSPSKPSGKAMEAGLVY